MNPAETDAAGPTGKPDRRIGRILIAVIAILFILGAFLRLNRYADNRSLHGDEAQFARNLIERTPAQLIAPLSYGQRSPAGFTLAVKFLTMALGLSEPVLRLVPLLAALVSLPLFYLLATKWLPQWGSILALFLFAISDALGHYAAWFDKYSSDVALTIAVLLVGVWFCGTKRRSRYLIFGAVGIAAVWFSYSVAIVLAGIGLPLFFSAIRRRGYREALFVALMAAAWLLSAAALWAVSIQPELMNPARGGFWASFGGFLIFPPSTLSQLEGDIRTLTRPFEEPLGFAFYGGVVVVYAIGVIEAVRRRGTAFFLVVPVLITILLSALRLYPIYVRLILFLVPILLLTAVLGMVRIWEGLTTWRERIVAFGFLALILYQPFRLGLARGLNPRELEEIRPLIVQWNAGRRSGDVLTLYYESEPAFLYYSHLLGIQNAEVVELNEHLGSPELYCAEVEPLAGQPRVWFLISHRHSGPSGNEEQIILDCLDDLGRQQSVVKETGASLYLYDLRAGPGDSDSAG